MTNTERLYQLLQQYAEDKSSLEELQELAGLLKDNDANPDATAWLEQQLMAEPVYNDYSEKRLQRVLAAIHENKNETRVIPLQHNRTKIFYRAAAAVVLLVIATGTYYIVNKPTATREIVKTDTLKNDVAPGRNGAILTLTGGKQVVLDSAASGLISKQGNAEIKNTNGQLVYESSKEKPTEIVFNTLTTQKGNTYQLVLPDGSKVWLNAASSITYPTAFTGTERSVTITGEAYFEIVHNSKMPFKVKAGNQTIEDIGTAFNVNSYPDEQNSRTTLIEGAVQINNTLQLAPGEQAIATATSLHKVSNVNTEEVVAWKNGLFNFNHADLKTVMRQLERWYDIEVKYEGTIPQQTFRGKITRDLNLSQVIKLLQDVDVQFRIENRTLIVTQ